jgi:hypothetical protein
MLFEHLFPVTAGSVLVVVCAVGPDFNTIWVIFQVRCKFVGSELGQSHIFLQHHDDIPLAGNQSDYTELMPLMCMNHYQRFLPGPFAITTPF